MRELINNRFQLFDNACNDHYEYDKNYNDHPVSIVGGAGWIEADTVQEAVDVSIVIIENRIKHKQHVPSNRYMLVDRHDFQIYEFAVNNTPNVTLKV